MAGILRGIFAGILRGIPAGIFPSGGTPDGAITEDDGIIITEDDGTIITEDTP